VPIYAVGCPAGHQFEIRQPFAAPLPTCPECGAATAKLPAGFGVGGRAVLPPRAEAMPQTWRGTYGANREYVTSLRRAAEARQRLEEKHPELAGDRQPVLAHEGRYAAAPLRAGDPVPSGHPHPHPHRSDGAAG
jgi:putative FmdB family regulatory protein